MLRGRGDMDLSTLRAINGNRGGVPYETYLPHLNQALRDAGCTTVLRVAHFMGQILHESGGLVYMREIHDGSNYEGRKDLNNIYPGDGKRFRGRGVIQLTGRHWATEFSKWAHSKGMVSVPSYFVINPEKMERPEWAFRTASFYWTVARPGINALCDSDDLIAVTKAVNGATRGLEDRRKYYEKAKALGDRILPSGATDTKGDSMSKNYRTVQPDIVKILNKHFTKGRGGKKIQYITRHHLAGIGTTNDVWNWWQTRQASAHYVIEASGKVGQLVWDSDTAWSNANTASNQVSIAIEHCNSGGANQDWPISNTVIDEGARWAAALCLYYKLGRPQFGNNIRDHREFGSTSCPHHLANGGKYHARWMRVAQEHYDALASGAAGGGSRSGSANTGTNTGTTKGDTLSAQAEKRIELILDQLAGPEKDKAGNYKFTGWPQLGDKTIVDNAVEQNKRIAALEKTVAALKGDK